MSKKTVLTHSTQPAGTRSASPRLVRKAPRPLALEQRFMFDGAAVVEAQQVLEAAPAEPAPEPTPALVDLFQVQASADTVPVALATAETQAQNAVLQWLAQPQASSQLSTLFDAGQTSAADWGQRVEALRQAVQSGEFSLRVVLLSHESLQGAKGAYADQVPGGGAVIYLNRDWLAGGADADSITRVLVEELGHAIDARLNGSTDTAGDEGEHFMRVVIDGVASTQPDASQADEDHAVLQLDGQSVAVELAQYTFVNAYEMVYDLNNSGSVVGSDGETAAEKEQSTHNFNFNNPLGAVKINDGSTGQNFSGNDVSATSIVLGGTTYNGWISRPIKSGGIVRGFYFWTDTNFTTLAAAQADNNMDGDSNAADNRGFVLVVDQAWFNTQITKTTTTVGTNIDGNASLHTYASVGSSSDRVDSALNGLLTPNSVLAVPDTRTVNEDSGASTGNLLSNDSDPNGDSFTLTSFSVAGQSGPFTLGTAYVISGVGSITLSANGDYSFTPVANYNGPVPVISYTVTDDWGATSTSTFTLTVAPVNDAPAAVNDTKTVTEDTPASGNVLGNDSDVDGDTLVVSAFSIAGESGTFTVGTPYTIAGKGVFTLLANGSYTFVPAANYAGSLPVITYTVSDGKGGTATATLTLTMTPVNDAPTAVADNADGSSFATAAGCTAGADVAATTQTGNVLGNDTDPDITVNPGVTHEVTAVKSELGSSWNGTTVAGRYGTLSIAADGSYTYTITDSNPVVKALAPDALLSETFTYTMQEKGTTPTLLSSTSTLRIVIKGRNDAPTAVNDFDAVNELNASQDTVASGNTITNYGTASAVASGVLTNDSDPEGSTLTVVESSITGTASTTFQTSTSQTQLTLTFTGTPSSLATTYYVYYLDSGLSDATPEILYTDATLTTLLRPSSVTGSGANRNVNLSVGSTVYFNGGSRVLAQSDVLGFSPDSSSPSGAKYYLATISSAPATVSSASFAVSATTGTVAVGMSVSGTADSGAFTAEVTSVQYNGTGQVQSFTLSSSGATFTASQAYSLTLSKTATAGTSLVGQYGYVDIAANGAYTYYLTSNALAANEVYTEKFTYTATDGTCRTTAVLSIRITGTQTQLTDTTSSGLEDVAQTGTVAVGGSTVSTFTWYGQTANAGATITQTGVGTLTIGTDGSYTFTPVTHYAGTVQTATYVIGDKASATLGLSITPVNDAPAGTDKSVTLTDKQTYTFATGDFGFSDPNDAPANTFSNVKITTLPSALAGTLTLNGSAVTVGQVIPVASLGQLVFTPVANAATDLTASFTFQVQDNGGTSNSGVDLDASPNTFTLNVTRVNDAPVNTLPGAITTNSYTNVTFSGLSTVISVADVDDADVDRRIDTVVLNVSGGTLSLTAGTGVTISGNGTGTVTLTSTGTQAQLQAVLASLVYSPTSTFSGTDQLVMTSTDKAGLTDVDAVAITVSADNRPLVVTGTIVNEASPYLVFEVDGEVNQWVSLALGTTGSGTGFASSGLDFTTNLQYFNGTSWVDYAGGLVRIPTTVSGGGANTNGVMLVRTSVVQDLPFESTANGYEGLKLTATNQAGTANTVSGAVDSLNEGWAQIRDDGQGAIYLETNKTFTANTSSDADYPDQLDDDRPLSVADITVNEASPYAVFTVTGVAGQKVKLALANTLTTSDTDATLGTDTGNAGTGSTPAVPLQYYNGSSWVDYVPGSYVTIPGTAGTANSPLLVRTAIVNDSTADNNETFTLTATNTGTSGATGTATIKDDGTGTKWSFTGNTDSGTSSTGPGSTFDDDRALTVTSPTVNEGSPYVVFTVGGVAGQYVKLGLSDGTALIDANGTPVLDGTEDYGPALQYFDGTAWQNYTANSYVQIPNGGTTLLVRTVIVNDTAADNGQTFKLTATNTGGTGTDGTATIKDDGTGTKWSFTGNTDSGTSSTGPGSTFDDDRALTVTSPTVNEGSPYVVFTVGGVAGQYVKLGLSDGTALIDANGTQVLDGTEDYGPALQYFDGTAWQNYTANSYVQIPNGGTTLLVRTVIVNDTAADNGQTFKLTATNTGGTGTDGTATIKDDGTGDIFKNDGTTDPAAAKDDDRPVTVSSPTVNEASPYAFFTVTGQPGQQVSLTLQDGTATGADYGPTLEVSTDGGATWTTYTTGTVALNGAGGTLLVRTPIKQDVTLEYSETFKLKVTTTGGQQAFGTGTIVDEGNGKVYKPDGSEDTSTTKDDDRPKPVPPPPPPPPPPAPKAADPVVIPEPPKAPPPPFNSALSALSQPMVMVRAPAPPIGDILTSNSGFRTVVNDNAPPGLTLNKGVTDQFVEGTGMAKVSMPADAFVHSKQDAVVTLQAKQANDVPLPPWVQFDPQTGSFEVNAPRNFKGKLDVKVLARDNEGREATAIFRIFVGEQPPEPQPSDRPAPPVPVGRSSLSEKLRLAAKRQPLVAGDMAGSFERAQPVKMAKIEPRVLEQVH